MVSVVLILWEVGTILRNYVCNIKAKSMLYCFREMNSTLGDNQEFNISNKFLSAIINDLDGLWRNG